MAAAAFRGLATPTYMTIVRDVAPDPMLMKVFDLDINGARRRLGVWQFGGKPVIVDVESGAGQSKRARVKSAL